MSDPAWRLLTTLPDLPTAQSIAEVLGAAGMQVRVRSDAGVLGQAAPSRIYVASEQWQQARAFLAAGAATDGA
jgi:hypothetical protein